jgi:hypothetical protein
MATLLISSLQKMAVIDCIYAELHTHDDTISLSYYVDWSCLTATVDPYMGNIHLLTP